MGLGAVLCLSPSFQHEVGQSQTISTFPSAPAASLPPGTFSLPQVTPPQSLRPTLKPFSSPRLPIILADSSPAHPVSLSSTVPSLAAPLCAQRGGTASRTARALRRCSPLLAAPRGLT